MFICFGPLPTLPPTAQTMAARAEVPAVYDGDQIEVPYQKGLNRNRSSSDYLGNEKKALDDVEDIDSKELDDEGPSTSN